jgi:hypothetical protein
LNECFEAFGDRIIVDDQSEFIYLSLKGVVDLTFLIFKLHASQIGQFEACFHKKTKGRYPECGSKKFKYSYDPLVCSAFRCQLLLRFQILKEGRVLYFDKKISKVYYLNGNTLN